jgi:hypothetical protein
LEIRVDPAECCSLIGRNSANCGPTVVSIRLLDFGFTAKVGNIQRSRRFLPSLTVPPQLIHPQTEYFRCSMPTRRVDSTIIGGTTMKSRRRTTETLSAANLAERTVHRRAVEAVIWGMAAVNFDLMYQAMVRNTGGSSNQIVYWSRLPDWKNQTLTPNPDSIYLMPFFNTKGVGAIVLEIPPADEGTIVGSLMDIWQTPLEDVGPAGVDKGKGGKYLILPPGYSEAIPDGYIPLPSLNYQGYALLRSILRSGSEEDIAKAVAYAKRIGVYPLSKAANPPRTKFVDAIDVVFDAIIPYDVRFFESLDRMVQAEPWLARDKAMIDQLRTIGIEKGKPFRPDQKTQKILKAAAAEAHAWLETQYESVFSEPYYQGTRWAVPAIPDVIEGMSTTFANPDRYPVDGRGLIYSYAFFCAKHLGAGGPVLCNDHQGWERPGLRRKQHLPPDRAGKRSGEAILVGNNL